MDMKRFFLYAIVIAALALAGCGGNGGGSDTAMPMPDPMPDPIPPTPTACPEGQVGTPPDCMDPTPTELTAQEMAFVNGLVNPSVPGDPSTSKPTTAVDRPGQATGEELAVTAGGIADSTVANFTLKSHLPRTTIGGKNIMGDDSPWMTKGQARNLGSFQSQTYEKTRRGLTDTLTLISNLDDPMSMSYTDYYLDTSGTTPAAVSDSSRPGVDSVAVTGVITLEVDTDFQAPAGPLFKAAAFPTANTGNDRTQTYEDDDAKKFKGSFNNIAGEFECTGTCTATANKKGELSGLAGAWTFTPDQEIKDIKIADARHDADYLSFGYWISETTTASSSRFAIGTVYAGSQDFNNDISGLTGSATYTGEAAGAYARKGDNPAVGEFTGQASLTAKFGDGTELGTISGTISDLVDEAGDTIDPMWAVDLQEAAIEQTATDGTAQAMFDGRTTGSGNWRGGFFGEPTLPASPTTAQTAAAYPHGVAGEFIGHFENGHVIGAFGATRR